MPGPSRYRRSSSSSRRPADQEPTAETEEDVSVELPEGDATFAEDQAGAEPEAEAAPAGAEDSGRNDSSARRSSARGRSGRSSRRMSASSDKRPSRRSTMSPEERAARRRQLMSAIKLALGLIILVGGGFAVYWFGIRPDPRTQQGLAILDQIHSAYLPQADSAIDNQKPEDADKAVNAAQLALDDIRKLDRPQLIPQVEAVKEALADRQTRIAKVKRDQRVQANLHAVLDLFAHLTDPDTDLDKLTTAAKAFLDNPVDWPTGSHSEDYLQQYATEVNRIAVKMASIEDERGRRKANETTVPVEAAQKAARTLTAQGKYQEALATIDEAARKFPSADFTAIRAWVNDDAQKQWESTAAVVNNLYADFEAIGSSDAVRKDALDKARAKLHFVIDNYGIATYVDQAKQLLAKHPEN